MNKGLENENSQALSRGQAPQRQTPDTHTEEYIYFEITADVIVGVGDAQYICQEANEATKNMVLLGMPGSFSPCKDVVLNPDEGISSYVTTTAQLSLGLRMNKHDAEKLSDAEVGDLVASQLRHMEDQARNVAMGSSIQCVIPELGYVTITSITRTNKMPEWFEEGFEHRKQELRTLKQRWHQKD